MGIDPILQTIEVYRLEGKGWFLVATHKGARTERLEPFDAIELAIGMLWER